MLICAFIGDGSVFGMTINGSDRVGEVMNKVKQMNPRKVLCDVSDITLYLAKKDNNLWLKTSDPDMEQLKQGVITDEIGEIMRKNKMDPTYRLDNAGIPSANDAANGDIHVLIEVPEIVVAKPFDMEKLVELALNKILGDPETKHSNYSLGLVEHKGTVRLEFNSREA
ncbi:Crinkler (CRN) family protein [Phytophthora palmivora]|uniref:Crinkler (CRN) family protein n=1 Tax=Phytophthora palmivora TaxID=4796 RepID=A0A2P4XNY8_9STRA|nr:Crinkler (CRN) family protein [Phytophthora palmivora]